MQTSTTATTPPTTTAPTSSCTSSDPADYNFECGSAQGWTFSSTSGLVGAAASSTAEAYAGTASLAVTFEGGSGSRNVWTSASRARGREPSTSTR